MQVTGAGPEIENDDAQDEANALADEEGLEVEVDRNEEIEVPFDPTKIDIIVKPMSLSALQDRLENRELDLTPDFQRQANLWNAKRKARLIESVLLRIPLPSFYFSEDAEGVYSVVDGLQRLCAIFHFQNVELLKSATGAWLTPLKLEGLQYLKEMEGQSFADIDRKFQRRISELEITANIIRANTPPAVKFNVFARLNQGGMPLNAQEIRNAIFPGEWRNQLRALAESRDFLKVTENKIRTERQQDTELVLRFIALWQLRPPFARPSNQTLDEFLNHVVQESLLRWTEKQWSEAAYTFKRSLHAAAAVFGRHAFRKSYGHYYRKPINRGLFEAQLLVLSEMKDATVTVLQDRKDLVSSAFEAAMTEDSDFTRALSYATGSAEASAVRISTLRSLLLGILDD
ncbi:DUF262 domain-containing protein [Pseudoxanthomonas gei]|uniref:DUF262 domain-containing protein n=1 Tax=Pseudoxanthomonas gei TaxID=1383030 RepID=A0ABX0AFK9_9GAMM|nr:DUF262 domain-containing protein [Pseudoxanthomonas gei]NDK39031.1 DUF262 domain-containing protein [Pseudoxanthomonas gei]